MARLVGHVTNVPLGDLNVCRRHKSGGGGLHWEGRSGNDNGDNNKPMIRITEVIVRIVEVVAMEELVVEVVRVGGCGGGC
jgi:hypothetical protein